MMDEFTTMKVAELADLFKPLAVQGKSKDFDQFDEDCDSFQSSVSDDDESEKNEVFSQHKSLQDAKRTKIQDAKLLLDISKRQHNRITESAHEAIKFHYIDLLKSQSASRTLQMLINSTESWIINEIFELIRGNLRQLLTNVYSNYFCHKLFGKLEHDCRKSFLLVICDSMAELSCDRTGTFSIQKIFEQISSIDTSLLLLVCEQFQKMSHSELNLMLKVSHYS